jgi:hypothetical protein
LTDLPSVVGLTQRVIEARGIPSVSVIVARDETEKDSSAARDFPALAIRHHFGVPFHGDLQRRVLFGGFYLLGTAHVSGTIRDVPVKWAEVRRETKTLTEQGQKL